MTIQPWHLLVSLPLSESQIKNQRLKEPCFSLGRLALEATCPLLLPVAESLEDLANYNPTWSAANV